MGDAGLRICSLLPSATEIVCALGLRDRLIGVTHECDWPPEARGLPAVTRSLIDHQGASSRVIHDHVEEAIHGGSSIYALDRELLGRLAPDLILTQELCTVCAVAYGEVRRAVRALPGSPTVMSIEPTTLDGIVESIVEVAEAAGVAERGEAVAAALRARIARVAEAAAAAGGRARPRVFALEWLDPPFVGGHWVPEMVALAGGEDGLGSPGEPSFALSWNDVLAYDPEVVVVMPCGFDLARTQAELARSPLPAALRSRVVAVDGSAYFNRPGPRVVDGLEILAEIFGVVPRQHGVDAWAEVAG